MKNLYQKIQDVSNEIKNIEKDLIVGKGTSAYKAASDIAVTLAVKEAETRNKLVSIPIKQELVNSEIVRIHNPDGSESLRYVDTIKMTVLIVDLEDKDSSLEVESYGKGVDSGDKGLGKASTYARKSALLNVYKIPTGEDPDAEASKSDTTFGISDMRKMVTDYLMQDERVRENVLQHFSLGSVDDFQEKDIRLVYDQLKSKKKL